MDWKDQISIILVWIGGTMLGYFRGRTDGQRKASKDLAELESRTEALEKKHFANPQ